MSRANESVYPLNTTNESNGGSYVPQMGLTIREHFAGLAMQGFLSTGNARVDSVEKVPELMTQLAKFSAQAADALIAELAKP